MPRLLQTLRLSAITCLTLAFASAAYAGDLRMATTTSTENSGLLKVLLPKFEAATGIHVQVIAVGTGKAVKLGESGDVDVVLVHARQLEDAFVASGGGIDRRDVMYNDFILVGPTEDPARVRGQKNVIQGMETIARADAKFISRGDNSGTDVMEKAYWKTANIDPKGKPWYVSAGLGMGEVLNMAAQMNAYTLSDRATYGAYRAKTGLDIVLAGDPRMFNPYGIIAVNPKKHPSTNYTDATKLIEWITSPAGQQAIADFKVNGEQVFFPDYGKTVAGGK